jgi:small nuclear ribonucleoprotein D3
MSIGVPIKVLHEAEGHIITCETNTGEVYRGKLLEAEDNMNCQMANITVTYRDGRVTQLENVFIRGSKIRFLILPDMLKNAPMFKKVGAKGTANTAAGRGKSAILRAQGIHQLFSLIVFTNYISNSFLLFISCQRQRSGQSYDCEKRSLNVFFII